VDIVKERISLEEQFQRNYEKLMNSIQKLNSTSKDGFIGTFLDALRANSSNKLE